MSEESIKPLFQTNSFDPEMIIIQGSVKFKGICLKQDCVPFIHGKVVNLYMFYEQSNWSRDLNTDFLLKSCTKYLR